MNIRFICSILSIIICSMSVAAQSGQTKGEHQPGKQVTGQRKYQLVVNEGNDSTISAFNRGLESIRGNSSNRGFMDNLVGLYKTTAAGQAVSLSSNLIDMGVGAIVSATKSKRPEWEKAIRGESTFIRQLPMQMEILDFYQSPSLNGPLDPTGMNFNGFGCRQVIEYIDENGKTHEDEVFYLSCRVRKDDQGIARMLNHSKFEIVVDTLRFNYALCDLPNDSLGLDTDKRIGFSFDKRSDLKFIVDANITSSWINQALMVYNDQPLGSFRIAASINPNHIDKDGVFRFYAGNESHRTKDVRVSGDCFLVPRSYVGSSDMSNIQDSWGTGQYKVEMTLTETCRINQDYYKTDGEWDNSKWKPEWKLIKSRRHSPSVFNQAWGVITNQYDNNKWVTILVDPAKSTFIQYETDGINKLINTGTSLNVSAATMGNAMGNIQQSGQSQAQGNGQQQPSTKR